VFDHNYNWYDPQFECGNPSIEPCDLWGHGTRTTGIAVGDDGGDNQIGVAPGARYITASYDGFTSSATVLLGMQWMLAPTDLNGQNPNPDLRPHVVNNSWGIAGGDNYFRAAVQAWVASGSSRRSEPETPAPPATRRCHLPITRRPMQSAPSIWMTWSRTSQAGALIFRPHQARHRRAGRNIRSADLGGSYLEHLEGTSFAVPHVTGTVALMWSLNPELIGQVETTRLHLDAPPSTPRT